MDRVLAFINDKKIAVLALVVLVLSLIPFFIIAHFARPGGDDLNYAIRTHAAWLNTGSVWAVINAAINTARSFYRSWTGEVVSLFLYSLMPEVFAPYTFWIGVYFILLCHIVGTSVFIYYFLGKILGLAIEYATIINALVLFIYMQFLPVFYTGIYWYTAGIHYILPHAATLLALVFTGMFILSNAKKYIIYTSVCMIFIGGGDYGHILFVIMVYALIILFALLAKKAMYVLWLLIPYVINFIGLAINVLSPGHSVRAGNALGFSAEYFWITIWRSFEEGVFAPFRHFARVPLILPALLLLLFFSWIGMLKSLKGNKPLITFKFPLLFVVIIFLVNCALNAPSIYAIELSGVTDASSGHIIVRWMLFFITWLAAILYLEGWLITKLLKKQKDESPSLVFSVFVMEDKFRKCFLFPAILLSLMLCLLFRGNVRDSFIHQAYVYLESGAAAEYKWRIAEYMEILLDDSMAVAYLKPINDKQGPLIHWTVMPDEDSYVNWTLKEFYRKERVVLLE